MVTAPLCNGTLEKYVLTRDKESYIIHTCGISLMVKLEFSKLQSLVRFQYPAPEYAVVIRTV